MRRLDLAARTPRCVVSAMKRRFQLPMLWVSSGGRRTGPSLATGGGSRISSAHPCLRLDAGVQQSPILVTATCFHHPCFYDFSTICRRICTGTFGNQRVGSGLPDSHLPAKTGKSWEESGIFGNLRKRCADFMTYQALSRSETLGTRSTPLLAANKRYLFAAIPRPPAPARALRPPPALPAPAKPQLPAAERPALLTSAGRS